MLTAADYVFVRARINPYCLMRLDEFAVQAGMPRRCWCVFSKRGSLVQDASGRIPIFSSQLLAESFTLANSFSDLTTIERRNIASAFPDHVSPEQIIINPNPQSFKISGSF